MNDKVKSNADGATTALAARICAVTAQSLNPKIITVTKRLIADGIAVAVAGAHEAAPTIAAEHLRAMACGAQASAWGFKFKTTADTRTMRVELEAQMSDGTVQRAVCTRPPGAWGAPVDTKVHGKKLRDCLGVGLAAASVECVLDHMDSLDRATAHDVAALIALLA